MATDLTKLAFDSRLNYLKRSEFVGNETITLGGDGSVHTVTVTHNLGYIPFVTVGAHLTDTSTIWSNDRVFSGTQSVGDRDISLDYWTTTTTLTIRIQNGNGSFVRSGNRIVYWAVYLDYGS